MRTVCSGDSTLRNICNREEIDADAFLMMCQCGDVKSELRDADENLLQPSRYRARIIEVVRTISKVINYFD